MATILVVDDRAENRELLTTILGYARHRILQAHDGAEALACARAERPDLVITDMRMPGMSGVELAQALRADADLKSVPILFYTAEHEKARAEAVAATCGVLDVLTKPTEPQRVLGAVAAALCEPTPPPEQERTSSRDGSVADELSAAGAMLLDAELTLARTIGESAKADAATRRRLECDLHDETGPYLSAVKMRLQMLLRRADAVAHAKKIQTMIATADAALARLRAAVDTLRK